MVKVRVGVRVGQANDQFVRLCGGQTNDVLHLLGMEAERHTRQRVVQICVKN